MNINLLGMAVFIAFGFVSWPVIGSYSKASGAWIGTMVLISTTAVVILLSSKQLINLTIPSYKSIAYLLVAGVINGLSCYFFSYKAADQTIPIGIFAATISILMVMMAPVLDLVINGNAFSAKQFAGLFTACGAIYLLN